MKQIIASIKPHKLQIKSAVIIILFLCSPALAELKSDDFINTQKKFISELYKNKRYFDCIAETQRLLSYKKDLPNHNELLYFINASYYSAGQYKTVISKLGNTNGTNDAGDKKSADIYLLAHSYLNTGYYKLCTDILNTIDYSGIDDRERYNLFANRAEIFIKNYEYSDVFLEIENAGKYIDKLNHQLTIHDFKNDMLRYNTIGLKSEWLSVSLSTIVPGAGQVYSGKIMDGLLSFAAVAGSAFGAYYFYNKKEKPLAITFAFFSCLFYGGNVYGAWNSASYANSKLNKQFSKKLIEKYNLNYNPMDYIRPGIFE